ncbi:uncharacterized protein BDV14DRAFT_201573 [Aspergillus stella-maris]|uniref:uncharacterized protein n=1 Tax=Aspergillus stella-maris TaxID=1810926 RepID=UPI003CCDFABD
MLASVNFVGRAFGLDPLPAGELSVFDLQEFFGVTWDADRDLFAGLDEKGLTVPSNNEKIAAIKELITNSNRSKAFNRLIINEVSTKCLRGERQILSASGSTKPLPCFNLDWSIDVPVVFGGEYRLLEAAMDYTITLGPGDSEDISVVGFVDVAAQHLVEVEELVDDVYEENMRKESLQCLACMARIYTLKKEKKEKNIRVWGMVSDGQDYEFLRVDNDGKVNGSNFNLSLELYSIIFCPNIFAISGAYGVRRLRGISLRKI